jgi:hypothetical protein
VVEDFEEVYARQLVSVWRRRRRRPRDRLLAELTPGQFVELASAIAWENHRARLNRALGVESMDFTAGGYCVLPERPAQG